MLQLDQLARAAHGFGAHGGRCIITHELHANVAKSAAGFHGIGDHTEVGHPRCVVFRRVRTVYLLLKRGTAHVLSVLLVSAIVTGAVLVFLSPIDHSAVEAHRLSGRVPGWHWIRRLSPFINTYAADI